MDLPDDLTLDEEEAGVTEEQGQGQNYYPVAIKDLLYWKIRNFT